MDVTGRQHRSLVPLAALVWFCVLVWSVVRTLLAGVDRAALAAFGTSGNLQATRELALQTLVIAAGPPAVGFVVAQQAGWRRAARIWGLLSLLALVGGLILYGVVTWEGGA